MKEQIFLFSLIVHINASILCYDSLLGLGIQEKLFTELSYKTNEDSIVTASCCQSNGTCHGGFVLPKSELKEFINPEKTSIHLRTKRSYDVREVGIPKNEIPCCPTNISVYFPITAVSAETHESVHVIQSDPVLLQPVLYGRCLTSRSPILQADCRQMYVAETMMTVKVDADNFKIERQPVMVPSGCECQLVSPVIKSGPNFGKVIASILSDWN